MDLADRIWSGFAVFFFHCASSIVACMFQPQEKTTKVEKGKTLPCCLLYVNPTQRVLSLSICTRVVFSIDELIRRGLTSLTQLLHILTFPLDTESCHTHCALQHDVMVYEAMNP